MNVEIGAEAAQFPEKEYINGIAVAVVSNNLLFANIFKSLLLYGENVQLASYA
jgi:hypothetical protein